MKEKLNTLPDAENARRRRSTMEGVAKAPKSFNHGDFEVTVKRHWEFPNSPMTAFSARRINLNWQPDVVMSTLWPCGYTAQKIAKKYSVPWIAIVHGYDFDVALNTEKKNRILAKSANKLVVVSNTLSRFPHRQYLAT